MSTFPLLAFSAFTFNVHSACLAESQLHMSVLIRAVSGYIALALPFLCTRVQLNGGVWRSQLPPIQASSLLSY